MLLYEMFLLYMKKLCATSTPLCSPGSTPTWPFVVKPPTYEPIGLIPTMNFVHLCLMSVFSMFADFL